MNQPDLVRELVRTMMLAENDVFVMRQRAREVAAAVGMEGQDQIRIATALSEVGRQLLARTGSAEVVFRFVTGPLLEVETSSADVDAADLELEPARRLVDRWNVTRADGQLVITMARRLPASAGTLSRAELDRISAELARHIPTTPLQELAVQNRNLMTTLEQIQAHRDELLRVNAELEETNRGVMALYTQLSDEMEATNRGVVALYAELDERTAQLRDASEAKTRFLANVSHELRAPATAVIGLLRLLQHPGSDPLTDEQRHQVQLASTSAQDMLSLVNQLLDLAKAESGRLDPQWSEVNLATLFQTLRGTLQPMVTKPEVALVVEAPADDLSLWSDEVLLAQILRNLLTNGIKFTEEGSVRLSASVEDDQVVIVVADTGPGIAPHEQSRVFEEFYQVRRSGQSAPTSPHKGTGLGLPYARRLASLLGGSLTLTSVPGEGSEFTVRLPGVRGPDGSPGRMPNHILVVEDDAAFRESVVGVLRASGSRVTIAGDGQAALDVLGEETPDLILLDLRLPELDGTAVLDHLAENERLRHIPVMVLTAFSSDVAHATAMPRATAILGKADTALDDLPSRVYSVLRNARR